MPAMLERRVRIIPATKPAVGKTPRRNGKQRVAAYCRVSTNSEEQLNSYVAQKAYYTQKIEANPDWELAGIFADEGISGTSMKKRTEFNRIVAACKRGRIDIILTKSSSRFARNTVDCLNIIRILKARGIGVIFEKENINTLTESSEFLITLFSSFSQAESESLSKNVSWGKQKSMEAGNVTFQYKKMLGYRKGPDGNPEIVPEEAETVRRIYRRYLEGASLADIKRELDADNVPTAEAVRTWSCQVIKNILTCEKYIGDALLQKTYITDCISKKVKKNNGKLPMYYVENHHERIISRGGVFQRVQEEMARRTSKRKVMQKTRKTEQGKYSRKYALSELLVCGECGTPYKRCTWAKNGKRRIVWRCVSRLEFGKKYCHNSPTMDENRLHNAIVSALNEYGAKRGEIKTSALELAALAKGYSKSCGANFLSLRQKMNPLATEQTDLLDKVLEDMDNPELNAQLKALSEEKQQLQEQIEALESEEATRTIQDSQQKELEDWMDQHPMCFTEFDDTITRRFVEKITVVDPETIRVKLRDVDVEIIENL